MTAGALRLAAAVTVAWALVWVFGAVALDPPLRTGWIVLIGVVATNVLVLAFGSVLWAPRLGAQRRPGRVAPAPAGAPLALAGPGLAYLRQGLTAGAAQETAELLLSMVACDAVAITDTEHMLGFAGQGRDHHAPGTPLYSPVRGRVIASGDSVVAVTDDLGCPAAGCPIESAVIAPLTVRDAVVGTLSVYRTDPEPARRDTVDAMAGILALHLELAEADRQRSLVADAQLEALRAQINPHFFFNVLNTIASKARTDSEEARQLLLRLADFFRYTIEQREQLAEFAQEYFFVRTYVTLEQARFGERLDVRYDVDPQVLSAEVPVLVVQPLVENAIRHGVSQKVGRGTVVLKARVDPLGRTADIRVRDDGVGMSEERLAAVKTGRMRMSGSGVGLSNISQRLALLYGDRYDFEVTSRVNHGTDIRVRIPLR